MFRKIVTFARNIFIGYLLISSGKVRATQRDEKRTDLVMSGPDDEGIIHVTDQIYTGDFDRYNAKVEKLWQHVEDNILTEEEKFWYKEANAFKKTGTHLQKDDVEFVQGIIQREKTVYAKTTDMLLSDVSREVIEKYIADEKDHLTPEGAGVLEETFKILLIWRDFNQMIAGGSVFKPILMQRFSDISNLKGYIAYANKAYIEVILKHGAKLDSYNENDIVIESFHLESKIDTSKPYLYSVLLNTDFKSLFKLLIDNGINPNVKFTLKGENKSFPLLHIMAKYNDNESVRKLLENGANPLTQDFEGNDASVYVKDNPKMVKMLEEAKANLKQYLPSYQDEEYIEKFYRKIYSLNFPSHSYNKELRSTLFKILHIAQVHEKHIERVMDVILTKGSREELDDEITYFNDTGATLKEYIENLIEKHTKRTQLLVAQYGDNYKEHFLNDIIDYRGTVIGEYIYEGNDGVVNTILRHNANLDIFNSQNIIMRPNSYFEEESNEKYILNKAYISPSHLKIYRKLVDNNINPNVMVEVEGTDRKYPLLHIMIRFNDVLAVRRLLENGANIFLKDFEGNTALDYAKDNPVMKQELEYYIGAKIMPYVYTGGGLLTLGLLYAKGKDIYAKIQSFLGGVIDLIKSPRDYLSNKATETRTRYFKELALEGFEIKDVELVQAEGKSDIILKHKKNSTTGRSIVSFGENDIINVAHSKEFLEQNKRSLTFDNSKIVEMFKDKLKAVKINLRTASEKEVEKVAKEYNKQVKTELLKQYQPFRNFIAKKAPDTKPVSIVSNTTKIEVSSKNGKEEASSVQAKGSDNILKRNKKEKNSKEEKGKNKKKKELEEKLRRQVEEKKAKEEAEKKRRKEERKIAKVKEEKPKINSGKEEVNDNSPKKEIKKGEIADPKAHEANIDKALKYLRTIKDESDYALNSIINNPSNKDGIYFSVITIIEKLMQIGELGGLQKTAIDNEVDMSSLKDFRNTIVKKYPEINTKFEKCLTKVCEYLSKVSYNLGAALNNSDDRQETKDVKKQIKEIYKDNKFNCKSEYELMDELKQSLKEFISNGNEWLNNVTNSDAKRKCLYNLAKIGQIRNDLGETNFVKQNNKFFENVLPYEFKGERNKIVHGDAVKVTFPTLRNLIKLAEKELLPTIKINKPDLKEERKRKIEPLPNGAEIGFGGV
jgi:ankyrin repeat protein